MVDRQLKYFILKPKSKTRNDVYAQASREALLAYARSIQETNPKLHDELWLWVQDEQINELSLKE